MTDPGEYVGTVHVRRIGFGSRHEHDAVFLRTVDAELELRTQGKSAFQQEEFVPFVGRRVTVTGHPVEGRLLFVTRLEPIDPPQDRRIEP